MVKEALGPHVPKEQLGTSQQVLTDVYKDYVRVIRVPVDDKNPEKGTPTTVYGLAVFEGLPIVFQAWHVKLGRERRSDWMVHVPYKPSEFRGHFVSKPFGKEEEEYVRSRLKEIKHQNYEELISSFQQNRDRRREFSDAVSLICDEAIKMSPLKVETPPSKEV